MWYVFILLAIVVYEVVANQFRLAIIDLQDDLENRNKKLCSQDS